MIQAYSDGVTVAANGTYPLNNVVFLKGNKVYLSQDKEQRKAEAHKLLDCLRDKPLYIFGKDISYNELILDLDKECTSCDSKKSTTLNKS